jgi:quercetin dioxygenase-like cupin family protein
MSSEASYIVKRADRSQHAIFPGVNIQTAAGKNIMLSLVEFESGAVVEEHSHPHEQAGMLIEGELTFTIGGATFHVEPGDMWRIPGGIPHKVVAENGPAKALDVFHPIRKDYL